jgi:hypothetical protein
MFLFSYWLTLEALLPSLMWLWWIVFGRLLRYHCRALYT